MDGSAIDNHNRKVYEETLKVIKKAWTEEAWDYNGEYYKVPFPYEDGIQRWPVAEWTRTYGAPGEVDDKGVVRKICVVPRPYQDPHPPLFSRSRSARIRSAIPRNRVLSRGSSFPIRPIFCACVGFIAR